MLRRANPLSPHSNDIAQVATGSYHTGMRVVGIKVLKNKLSEYVKIAASGETVLVTDRDRVVAELVPPRAERAPTAAAEIMAQGVREGWVTPATIIDGSPPPRVPFAATEQLLEELGRDREDR